MINLANIIRPYRRDEQGGVTLEFVIGLPLLMVAMVFVFEFSTLFWAHHIATNNVRSAVRYLARAPLEEPYLTQATNMARTGNALATTGSYGWMDAVAITVEQANDNFSKPDFRNDGQIIRIRADIPFVLNTLAMMNAFSGNATANNLTVSVVEEARHIGE